MKHPIYTEAEIKRIVLLGMHGTPIPEICRLYNITSSMYYEWRDMLFAASFFIQKSNRR